MKTIEKRYEDIYPKLNELVMSGDIVVKYNGLVFSPKVYHSKKKDVNVDYTQTRFLGGGVSEGFYTVSSKGKAILKTDSSMKAAITFWDALLNY